VSVAAVAAADVAGTFEAAGVVQARTTAVLTSRIVAPVTEVRVTAGDRVRAGDVLVILDSRDLEAGARRGRTAAEAAGQGAMAAAAEERAAQATRRLARATHDRVAALAAKRSATAHELDEATAGLAAAEARAAGAAARALEATSALESARAASAAADATESFTRMTAPFDGLVSEKRVEPGNMATPGAPLLVLEDTQGFRLDVRIDESRARHVAVGAAIPVLIGTDSLDATATVNGTVSEVARAADVDAHTFLIKIALPAAPGLRTGMFGRARFGGPSRRVLTVPEGAIVRRGQVASVFTVEGDVARLRMVNLSGREVVAGLSDGEIVVVNPPAGLVDGRRVRPEGR
jgi:multidrug efflux pump subunit AcrA (membrane-fusion protein)